MPCIKFRVNWQNLNPLRSNKKELVKHEPLDAQICGILIGILMMGLTALLLGNYGRTYFQQFNLDLRLGTATTSDHVIPATSASSWEALISKFGDLSNEVPHSNIPNPQYLTIELDITVYDCNSNNLIAILGWLD